MIIHLRIQYGLALGIGFIVILFHFFNRIYRGLDAPWSSFEPLRTLPYAVLVLAFAAIVRLKSHRERAYLEFLQNSPGRDIDVGGISFGVGHPTDQ